MSEKLHVQRKSYYLCNNILRGKCKFILAIESDSSKGKRMGGHLPASYLHIRYGVGLLLILLPRFCQNLIAKISFQHHAFFVCVI